MILLACDENKLRINHCCINGRLTSFHTPLQNFNPKGKPYWYSQLKKTGKYFNHEGIIYLRFFKSDYHDASNCQSFS